MNNRIMQGGGTSANWTIKQQTGSLMSKVRSIYAKPQDRVALSVKERAETDASVSLISKTSVFSTFRH